MWQESRDLEKDPHNLHPASVRAGPHPYPYGKYMRDSWAGSVHENLLPSVAPII